MLIFSFFFFNDTATTEIYTLSLHDALPICVGDLGTVPLHAQPDVLGYGHAVLRRHAAPERPVAARVRSEEHTSELQSPCNLVCRLLLEKKKKNSSRE